MKNVVYILVILHTTGLIMSSSISAKECHTKYGFFEFSEAIANDFFDLEDSIIDDFDNYKRDALKDFADFSRMPWRKISQKPIYMRPLSDRFSSTNTHSNDLTITSLGLEDSTMPCYINPKCDEDGDILTFVFFGTPLMVRLPKNLSIALSDVSGEGIAQCIEKVSLFNTSSIISDCIKIRDELNLCDWAYLNLLDCLCTTAFEKRDEQKFMLGLLYMLSGYTMRFATDGLRLFVLFGCNHIIYEAPVFDIDGSLFYSFEPIPKDLKLCNWSQYEGKPLCLSMLTPPKFSDSDFYICTHTSVNYPEISFTVKINKNLIDFYETYPESEVNSNRTTRWALYAQNEFSASVKDSIQSQLSQVLHWHNEIEGANMLLDLVQTGFKYEIDNVIWGKERIFFAEESLYYPFCDCEDRAILYSRLVRDILNLECVLVCYPGHIATAIHFSTDIDGEGLMVDNRRFVIADPTYIGAKVGESMPNVDNKSLNVITLNK